MTTVRAFCAFEIPENVVGTIIKGRRSLEKRLPRARWVRPGNMHLTLLFLRAVSLLDLEAFEAREVVVILSDLRPDGPVYTVFERIRLT